ncbi:hypothetical protein [Pedobacter sp. MW01-1-1]|uniref:hypothetical protein n=1 Tax=Pedobacter sp. MW01-1-1 TaxID=3383027 RepID=UPI003FEDE11B
MGWQVPKDPKRIALQQKLAKNDTYIDFDLDNFTSWYAAWIKENYKSKISRKQQNELAKCRAMLYRFYSHVKIENCISTLDLKNGTEINISEKLFNKYASDEIKANEGVLADREKGLQVQRAPISKAYLDHLIND